MNVMSRTASKRILYSIPVIIGSSALAVALIAPQIATAQTPDLPSVTTTQLVSWISNSHPVPLSGTVTGVTSFPIPSVSALSKNPSASLSGSSSASYNIWENGKGSFRIQSLTTSGETDLYVIPGSVWLWDSSKLTATKEAIANYGSLGVTSSPNPQVTASSIVSKLSRQATLSVSGTTVVAGRPAYTLSISPNAPDSLIGSINISVDAVTHLADQIQVIPKGSATPAASLGFNTVSFSAQPNSIFDFSPPPGVKVVIPKTQKINGSPRPTSSPATQAKPKIVGTGFDAVVVAHIPTKALSRDGALLKVLHQVSTSQGTAYEYSNPIFQALILPNGTIVAGSVSTSRLIKVIGTL
ncbi:MAG: hypothetical protein M1288_05525 [Actinobacteria bacterium]|jgi:outer membrane lipoprotein-sorting protein|nr:hypothetical protein [Actinomycetota bacterium]